MVKINITLGSKTFYTLIAILSIAVLSVFVYAYKTGASPSIMGHSAEELEVTLANGSITTLQNAVTNNYIGGGSTPAASSACKSVHLCGTCTAPGKVGWVQKIDIPSFCIYPKECLIKGVAKNNVVESYIYSQYPSSNNEWGPWSVSGFTFPNRPVNGNTVATTIVTANTPGASAYVRLYDDTPSTACQMSSGNPSEVQNENDAQHWTLFSTEVDCGESGYILICPLENL